jgi:hypothetical protein
MVYVAPFGPFGSVRKAVAFDPETVFLIPTTALFTPLTAAFKPKAAVSGRFVYPLGKKSQTIGICR